MDTNITIKSKCCNAKVKVIGKVTMYYVCLKCKKACDIIFIQRKVWTKNPNTKVENNNKIYNRKKSKQQLRKLKEEI